MIGMSTRHIFITGTQRGIGRHLAEYFFGLGDEVIGCSRTSNDLTAPGYTHYEVDVTDEDAARTMFAAIAGNHRHLDIVINNAGVARMSPATLMPPKTAARIMDVNFLGTYNITHHAVRLLRHSSCARIINFSTVAVPWRLEGEAVYAASKAAVEHFTRTLARELGPLGITVNAIGPSPIRTDLLAKISEEKLQALIDRQHVKRWAEPADVINAVDFFCRPASGMVSGQILYLGGAG